MSANRGFWQRIWDAVTNRQLNESVEKKPRLVKRPIGENVLSNDFWMAQYIDYLDRFKEVGQGQYPISNPGDRRYGSNYPFWQTEQQLGIMRAQSRLVCTTSPNAIGLLNGLCSYIIGPGFNYRISTKNGKDVPEETINAAQEVVDKFHEGNDWALMEAEIFTRSRTDGECFLRLFPQKDGCLEIRTIEPEMVFQKPDEPFATWSYGIETAEDDIFKVLNYYVDYYAPGGEDPAEAHSGTGEVVPAEMIVHIKCNVPKSIKRGIPDFSYETLDAFSTASKLRKNLGEGASVQSAIAAVRQHEAADQAQVEDFVDEMIDYSVVNNPTGRQTDYQKIEPGTFLDIPKGMKYVAPPGASSSKDHLEIFQALLRSAGNRHNAPEWLSSANTAGSNYASSLTAESPFLRNCVRLQTFYKSHFKKIIIEAIKYAAMADKLPSNILDDIEIIVTPPAVEARDKIADATANQMYLNMRAKSLQTIDQELGLDFEAEQRNFEQMDEAMANADIPPGGEGGVADSALNGLQIENLTNIVLNVAAGRFSSEVGKAIAKAAFPMMDESALEDMFRPDLYKSIDPKENEGGSDVSNSGGGSLLNGEDPVGGSAGAVQAN